MVVLRASKIWEKFLHNIHSKWEIIVSNSPSASIYLLLFLGIFVMLQCEKNSWQTAIVTVSDFDVSHYLLMHHDVQCAHKKLCVRFYRNFPVYRIHK